MKTVSVKMSGPLANWLDRRARELGRTQSDIIRAALERERIQDKNNPSCRDLLGDMDGFFDGPSDLSTNPKYLEGFACRCMSITALGAPTG